MPFDDQKYDIIIGPTADDRLFTTLDLYLDGVLSVENAIKLINDMHYSEQIVIKKQSVIDSKKLQFVEAKEIIGQEKEAWAREFRQNAKLAAEKTVQLLKEMSR